ncbi:MAG: diacylglycerol kinase family protein [Clostridia bacterium]|nr:diacylglycerol kinase family protein [Clostridia bacterium]
MKTYILYNPLAGDGNGAKASEALLSMYEGEVTQLDITKIEDYNALLSALSGEDRIVVCGGDGTLNRFANAIDGIDVKCEICYYALGTGNDFLHDLGKKEGEPPVRVNEYLKDLPVVEVGGERHRFLNGIGFGIDGYCCEVGDRLKAESKKPNYTAIAIKGLLFHYKPTNATITVDGKSYSYKKVWIAAAMKGRFYGGGMMTAPDRDRERGKEDVTLVVMYGKGKLKTLMVFPSIFKGEHVNHKEMVAVHTGKEISVTFDRPTALQIDGETVLDVTNYKVTAGVGASVNAAEPTTV